MQPGMIRYRGYAIEDLIGRVGFAEMVYLLTRGELPHRRAGPSSSRPRWSRRSTTARRRPRSRPPAWRSTCGVGINNAMASAINMLGDVHGGAGEQCVQFYNAIAERIGGIAADGRC